MSRRIKVSFSADLDIIDYINELTANRQLSDVINTLLKEKKGLKDEIKVEKQITGETSYCVNCKEFSKNTIELVKGHKICKGCYNVLSPSQVIELIKSIENEKIPVRE